MLSVHIPIYCLPCHFVFRQVVSYTLYGFEKWVELFRFLFWRRELDRQNEGLNMSRVQTKRKIELLREQLKAANQASDTRLLKLAVLMVMLALIAALIHGKIHF